MNPDESSSVYGLKQHARFLCAQMGEHERNRFLVGTVGSGGNNEVCMFFIKLHLIDFNEEDSSITNSTFKHSEEIWHISSSPAHSDTLFICSKNRNVKSAALYRINGIDDESPLHGNGDLQKLFQFTDTDIGSVIWDPSESSRVIALSSNSFSLFNVSSVSNSVQVSGSPIIPKSTSNPFWKGMWSPHNLDQIGLSSGRDLFGFDLRSSKMCFEIRDADDLFIKDFDFNPNRSNYIATGGDDGSVKFWDTRAVDKPLLTIANHTHWITSIAFNKFHDQLILTSSTDNQVNLESVISLSSASFQLDSKSEASAAAEEDDTEPDGYSRYYIVLFSKPDDGLVKTYEQHEDSVYSVAWSTGDPWIFASLSYDGRVVINSVPQEHKYKIIL